MTTIFSEAEKPRLLGVLRNWTKVYLQVKGPGIVYLSQVRQELDQRVSGIAQGLEFVSGDGLVNLSWKGELWSSVSAAGTVVDFQFLQSS